MPTNHTERITTRPRKSKQVRSSRKNFATTMIPFKSKRIIQHKLFDKKFLQNLKADSKSKSLINKPQPLDVEIDKKTLTPRTKKIAEIGYFRKDRVEKLIEAQDKEKEKGIKKNRLRKTNLINKLLKGKFVKQSTLQEMILFSLTKRAQENLKNIELFSDERKIAVKS